MDSLFTKDSKVELKGLDTSDDSRNIYVLCHVNSRMFPQIRQILLSYGFQDKQIMKAVANKTGIVGDYVANLWPPLIPTHIRFHHITEVEEKSEKIVGKWAGVVWEDIQCISLPNLTRIPMKLCVFVSAFCVLAMIITKKYS